MAEFYAAGETKPRPGIYQRFVNRGAVVTAGAETGVIAIPIQASWGPLNKVTVHENAASIKNTYGTEGTTDAAVALFEGGASKVYCIRMGKGDDGQLASLELKNNAGEAETAATVSAIYPGTRPLSIQIRQTSASNEKEIIVYDGTTKLESFTFTSGEGVDERKNLKEAIATSGYISVELSESVTDNTIAVIGITELLSGSNPDITTESYSNALNALEAYGFNYIALDSVKPEHQAILVSWLERVYSAGKLVIAVLGGENSKGFDAIKEEAGKFDNKQIIYSGICGTDISGNAVDSYRMAALVCGAIAGIPTTESIVHKTVPGIADIIPFTNKQYETAINSGFLLASLSAGGTVWFDSGVNTLKTLSIDEDAGWKKIRRVATRFELMRRVDEVTAPLIGQVNCDKNGIAIIIQTAQGVLNDMVAEGKLANGALIYEDPENPFSGESAWFIIDADDTDSFEKGYFRYQFRFSQNS